MRSPLICETHVLRFARVRVTNTGFLLVVLTLITLFWSIRYSTAVDRGSDSGLLMFFLSLILLTLLAFFVLNRFLSIYVSFELSVIPIFIIVIGWGYQRERLAAGLNLLFYTLTASIPLLVSFIWIRFNLSTSTWHSPILDNSANLTSLGFIFRATVFLAFAVKLPLFGVHMWLPKAHVEAPVIGSIALAAILLKLGRYGLWLFLPFYFSQKFVGGWFSLSMLGALSVRILCLRLRDLKIIIAYSSVGHMGLMAASLFMATKVGMSGALFIILAHGMRSSAIFIMAYVLYQANHSRSLLLTKGIISWCRTTPLFWFLILIANIASPPTFNLLAEVLVITRIVAANKMNAVLMVIIIIARTGYSLIMYRSTMQGVPALTSLRRLTLLSDLLIFFNHIVWVFLIILGLGVARLS